MEEKTFKKHFRCQLAAIHKLINEEKSHCILSCLDSDLLTEITDYIAKDLKAHFANVRHKINLGKKYNDTLFILNMDTLKKHCLQRKLYYLFEMTEKCNFSLIYTNKIDCIDIMEKRVRSRFNNEVIYFPLVLSTKKQNIKSENILVPTLSYQKSIEFNQKYSLQPLKFADIFSILTPLHLAILILSKTQPIDHLTVYEHYQRFTLGEPALRKRNCADVVSCYYELRNLQLVKSTFSGDWIALEDYVCKNSPIYIKYLLKKIKKSIN